MRVFQFNPCNIPVHVFIVPQGRMPRQTLEAEVTSVRDLRSQVKIFLCLPSALFYKECQKRRPKRFRTQRPRYPIYLRSRDLAADNQWNTGNTEEIEKRCTKQAFDISEPRKTPLPYGKTLGASRQGRRSWGARTVLLEPQCHDVIVPRRKWKTWAEHISFPETKGSLGASLPLGKSQACTRKDRIARLKNGCWRVSGKNFFFFFRHHRNVIMVHVAVNGVQRATVSSLMLSAK